MAGWMSETDLPEPYVPAEPYAPLPHAAPGAPEPEAFPYAPWGPVRAIGMAVAALIAGVVIGLPFIVLDGDPTGDDLSLFTTVGLQISAGIAFILIPILLARRYGGDLKAVMRRLGFVSFRPGAAAKWIGIGIASYFGFAIAYTLAFGAPQQDDIAGDFGPIGLQILLIVVLAPLSEEICFRGMLFGGLRTRLPMWAAALGAGAIFGALHYSTGLSAVPSLVVLGAIFAVVYEKTGSIWPPIIMHVANNAFALAVLSSS
jgi:membrane protease YdiL (CAAX protease family)